MTLALRNPKPAPAGCVTGCRDPLERLLSGLRTKSCPPLRAGWQHANEGCKLN